MTDILTGWVDQQAEQARLVNAVAKAAVKLERDKCILDVCYWCRYYGSPEIMSNGNWLHRIPDDGHEHPPGITCVANGIRIRAYHEDQADMNP